MSSVVFTFGRMNPPTRGHKLLVSKVVQTAKKIGADHIVYLSQTNRAPNDPLEWDFKRRVCVNAFTGVNISNDVSVKNPFIAIEILKDTYDNIIMIAGSDQVTCYSAFKKYTDQWGIHFEVVSAGERVSGSRGIAGISASKLRKYANEGNKNKFFQGLPLGLSGSVMELVYKNTQRGIVKSK
jgi:nicotinic acid mononucleotide adenylyltransferase